MANLLVFLEAHDFLREIQVPGSKTTRKFDASEQPRIQQSKCSLLYVNAFFRGLLKYSVLFLISVYASEAWITCDCLIDALINAVFRSYIKYVHVYLLE